MNMNELVIEFWYWWVLGVALIALEALIPGTFLMWLGIAAGVVGLIAYLAPNLALTYEVLIFAVLSVVAVVVGRTWLRRHPVETEDPDLNLPGQRKIGQVLVLAEAIENGEGRAKVGDSLWKVRGPDAPAESRVRVVGADGATLMVEPVDDGAAE